MVDADLFDDDWEEWDPSKVSLPCRSRVPRSTHYSFKLLAPTSHHTHTPRAYPPVLLAHCCHAAAQMPFAKHMVAGSMAGLMEHAAMYPVDTVKVRVPRKRVAPCVMVLWVDSRGRRPQGAAGEGLAGRAHAAGCLQHLASAAPGLLAVPCLHTASTPTTLALPALVNSLGALCLPPSPDAHPSDGA